MFRELAQAIRRLSKRFNSAEGISKVEPLQLEPDIPARHELKNTPVDSPEGISKVEPLQLEPDIPAHHELMKPPVNSPEVISKVEQLQPELDRLMRQEIEEDVRFQIELIKAGASNYVDHIRSISGKSSFKYKLSEEQEEQIALNMFEDLQSSYADYLNACPMSPEQEQEYIVKRAHTEMHRFGACHGIWNLQKSILKEKYGIQWYTPDETHPDIDFD